MSRYLRAATCLICLSAFGCSPAEGQQPPKPLLIPIGSDVSSSLTPEELLDSSHVRRVCTSIAESGRGGTVAFDAIGNPSGRKLLRCAIQPNPVVDHTLPPTRKKEAEKRWKEIQQQNVRAIRVFIDSCHRRMAVPLQSNTDLNGFFVKVSRLCNEPQFAAYEKIVFANTDGLHDVTKKVKGKAVKDTALRCGLPDGVQLWVSGWESSQTCNTKYSFESPSGFTDFLHQYLTFSNSNKHGK